MKYKTVAVWLTLCAGPLGLHRIYLNGRWDSWGKLIVVPTVLGLYGVSRARGIGLDDALSWLLIPLLGLTMAGCALHAIVYGLMDTSQWNARYNPESPPEHVAGETGWFTIAGLVGSLLIGATVLLSTIAFSFQHYFEYQADTHTSAAKSFAIRKFAG